MALKELKSDHSHFRSCVYRLILWASHAAESNQWSTRLPALRSG